MANRDKYESILLAAERLEINTQGWPPDPGERGDRRSYVAFMQEEARPQCVRRAFALDPLRRTQMRLFELEAIAGRSQTSLDEWLHKGGNSGRQQSYGAQVAAERNFDGTGNRSAIQCYDLDKFMAWLKGAQPKIWQEIQMIRNGALYPQTGAPQAATGPEQPQAVPKLLPTLTQINDAMNIERFDVAHKLVRELIEASRSTSGLATTAKARLVAFECRMEDELTNARNFIECGAQVWREYRLSRVSLPEGGADDNSSLHRL